jgi:hypothetical protein
MEIITLNYAMEMIKNYINNWRTFLRILWFLDNLIHVFGIMLKDECSGSMKIILGNSYDKILPQYHIF